MHKAEEILVGYIEEKSENNLYSDRLIFHNKIGGRPSWTDISTLPSEKDLVCPTCDNLYIFLAQIITEGTGDKDQIIINFLLSCWTCSNSIKLITQKLNCELDIIDDFYFLSLEHEKKLNELCCAHCALPHSDSNYHNRCHIFINGISDINSCLPCFLIYLDVEQKKIHQTELDQEYKDIQVDATEEIDEYKNILTEINEKLNPLVNQLTEEVANDAVLAKYLKHMEKHEPQVVRFSKVPLWFCSNGVLENFPTCERCGERTELLFQLHSSILDYLGLNNNLEVSFGAIFVFMCPRCAFQSPSLYAYKQRDTTIDKRVRLEFD